VVLIAAPNPFLAPFGFAPTREVWIRVIGFLALALGYYYVRAAREEARPFFRWSVHGRAALPFFLGALVLLADAPPALLAFGLVDLGSAIWTAIALRRDEEMPPRSG
jgi:hypothetical protein